MGKSVGSTTSSPNAVYRDFLNKDSDSITEIKIKTALIAAGALLILGMAFAIYMTSAGKMAHISDPYGKFVPGHYEGGMDSFNWYENWIEAHYEATSLAAVNYTFYAIGLGLGTGLVAAGIRYNRASSQRSRVEDPVPLVKALKTDTLRQMHERLYQKANYRKVDLEECVRKGLLTPKDVETIDTHLRSFQTQFVKEGALLAEQEQISKSNGGKSVSDLMGNANCTDRPRLSAIASELRTIHDEMERLEAAWKTEDLFNKVANAAAEGL